MTPMMRPRGARPGRTVRRLLAIGCLLGAATTQGASAPADAVPGPAPGARAHDAHHVVVGQEPIRRTAVEYRVPHVRLVRDDGKAVDLAEELDDGRPVFVDFIYTTCTAICPVTSATFAALQERLGAERDKVRMVSISIDPEEDTPRRLAGFRQKYGAGPQWHHYTGTAEASIAAQRAFGVYTGDKMGHTPATLYRGAPGQSWIRLDGFATPDDLLSEYRRLASR
jgi:protein SCO1/2